MKKEGLSDAMKRLGEALASKDWSAAAEAFMDADKITDMDTGEADKKGEDDKGGLGLLIMGKPKKD